ncbi:MAG: glycoside hydrolase family 130 protein [Syntrophothermus sp.]
MITRKTIHLKADPKKVLMQFFYPGSDARVIRIIKRVISLSEVQAEKELTVVMKQYAGRHRKFNERLLENFRQIEPLIPLEGHLSENKKLLAGAYFSKEYSIESAALFNPSIVRHPDQSGVNENEVRFIISLRAAGEGHISSVVFRTGKADSDGNIRLDEESGFIQQGRLANINAQTYSVIFDESVPLQERVLFPQTQTESNGMEDARFVKLEEEDLYAATYTAYNGHSISIQMIETRDFREFKIFPLEGKESKDKGMALFPRRINGLYTMISRQDGENIYIMQSENRHVWNSRKLLRTPQLPWEFVQLGNCGSPIETKEGWLLMTHAVGPFRSYSISALLLDKEDPSRVKGYLPEPLIEADENEREGYVPNVVYSCGSIITGEQVIIPYAMSDSSSGFAVIPEKELLSMFIRT